jgi:flavin reductase (DIM6/NTAB) family NADH-FMN oxidoreductase RutF
MRSKSYLPLQTVIVTSRSKGFDNATTFSWQGPLSMEPFLYGIQVRKTRKIYEMILESKVFCVNFLSGDMDKIAMLCGTKSGNDVDKFKVGKIGKEECESIDCPRIKGCPAYLECRLVKTLEITPESDHLIFVGEVIKEVDVKESKRLLQNDWYGFTTEK